MKNTWKEAAKVKQAEKCFIIQFIYSILYSVKKILMDGPEIDVSTGDSKMGKDKLIPYFHKS